MLGRGRTKRSLSCLGSFVYRILIMSRPYGSFFSVTRLRGLCQQAERHCRENFSRKGLAECPLHRAKEDMLAFQHQCMFGGGTRRFLRGEEGRASHALMPARLGSHWGLALTGISPKAPRWVPKGKCSEAIWFADFLWEDTRKDSRLTEFS